MKLTVAICTGGRDSLVHAIRSLANQSMAPDKLLIVDQSGKGRAQAFIEEVGYTHPWEVVEQDEKGLSRARNAVVERLDTDWVFFTDDDCVVSLDLVDQLHRVVKTYPKAAFLAGACLWPLDYDAATEDAPGMTVRAHTKLDAESTFKPFGFMGGCLAFSKAVIDAVGKFDEELGAGADLFTGEESDFIIRAISKGFVGWTSPRMVVYHDYGARKRPENNLLNGRLGNAALLWKYRKMGDPIAIALAERILPYGPKRALLSRLSLGGRYREDGEMYRMVQQLYQKLDSSYTVENGLLKKRP
jgi:GT2 family glycosyltransferase